jgi:archaemetzincin
LLYWIRDALADSLGCDVALGDAIPLSVAWYDDERRQYRGTEILRALREVPRQEEDRVLGLADVDCFASGLNFVFGQAAPHLAVAFVALSRLRQSFYGLSEDQELFRQRVLKETVHELGHTWGLSHCPNTECVMHFSNTLGETDAKSATFCERCEQQLRTRWRREQE